MKKVFCIAFLFALGIGAATAATPNWKSYNKLPTTPGGLQITSNCRSLNGTVGPCTTTTAYCELPDLRNVPNCDIDGQPRYEPYPPIGCSPQLKADIGADQSYRAGCEPVVTIFGSPSYCPGIAVAETAAWNHLLLSSAWRTYAKSYPTESASIKTWYTDGAPGALLATKTHFGAAIVQMINLRYITSC